MFESKFKEIVKKSSLPEIECIDLSSLGGGTPDLLLLYRGMYIFCELKVEDNKLEPSQKNFMREHLEGDCLICVLRYVEKEEMCTAEYYTDYKKTIYADTKFQLRGIKKYFLWLFAEQKKELLNGYIE